MKGWLDHSGAVMGKDRMKESSAGETFRRGGNGPVLLRLLLPKKMSQEDTLLEKGY